MIYVRGDTHRDLSELSEAKMPGESSLGPGDILIVTGDFGFVFLGGDKNYYERTMLDTLARKPYTILFLDGNHEGFPYLETYPEEIRYGAPVRKIRDNIFWLRRGYIYTIEGKTFFVMGGAYSMDKAGRLKHYELTGEQIWFEEELPTAREYRRAIKNLQDTGMQVDYVLSHTAPKNIIRRLLGATPEQKDAELTGFLDWVYHDVSFRKWYFGHFHLDEEVTDQMIACLRQLRKISE